MAEQLSRPKRWEHSVSSAKALLEEYKNKLDYVNDTINSYVDELNEMAGQVNVALEDLQSVQSEYEDWQLNLPENLVDSPTAQKLEEVMNIDLALEIAEIEFEEFGIDTCHEDVETVLEEAESVELPRGFGRD